MLEAFAFAPKSPCSHVIVFSLPIALLLSAAAIVTVFLFPATTIDFVDVTESVLSLPSALTPRP